jgi:hypothetical protein
MTSTTVPTQTDKAAFWSQHLSDWSTSGLTQKDYCREHGLSHRQFLYWRSRQKMQQQDHATPQSAVPVSIQSDSSVPHHPADLHSKSNTVIELSIGKAQLRLPMDVSPDYIASLVSALQ